MKNLALNFYKIKQEGAALIFALFIGGVLISIIIALSSIFIGRLKTVSEIRNSSSAAYAADSAIEWCIFKSRHTGTTVSGPTLGNGAVFVLSGNCSTGIVKITGTFQGITRAFEITFP